LAKKTADKVQEKAGDAKDYFEKKQDAAKDKTVEFGKKAADKVQEKAGDAKDYFEKKQEGDK